MIDKLRDLLQLGVDRQTTVIKTKTVTANAGATSIMSLFKVPLGVTMLVEATIFAKGATGSERAVYKLVGAIKNIAGTTALVGTVSVTAFEDDAAWAATFVANDTKDTIDLQVTPDTATDTVFWGYATAILP